MRIFLIGFMGSGKSHVGKRLAKTLSYEFIDADQHLEEQSGMSISDIFATRGEGGFRNLESAALKSLGTKSNCIISTGGGAPCFFDNMEWMNANGVTVYLKVAPAILLERLLPRTENRPLLIGKSPEELEAFIKTSLVERASFYEQAEIILNQTTIDMDRVALLQNALKEHLL
ncbi:MAG: shikimate kinase [Bacteroidota bacterium]